MFRIIVACCLLAGMHGATADLGQIRERGALKVGIKNDRAGSPDGHKDPAHFHKRGFEVALAHALAEHLFGAPDQVEFSTRRKPLRLRAVAQGEVDLGIAMHRIAAGDEAIAFSTPYFETGLACLQRAGGGIATLADLAGKTVGVVARNNDELPGWLTEATAGLAPAPRLVSLPNFREAAAAIEGGRLDALVSEAVNIDAFLANHGSDLERSPPLTHERVGVAVAKGNHELLQFVNAVLVELERTGRLAELRAQAGLAR